MTVSFTAATTRATADDLYYTDIVDMSVIDAAYSARVMQGLVYNYSLANKPTDTAKFPRWPALTAASVAETADLANTNIATTSVTATVGEVGITIALTDALLEDDVLSGMAEYGRQAGLALADKMDADCAALFSGFSNVTGTTSTAFDLDDFLAAIGNLEARDAPKPYVAVLHPVQWYQMSADIATSSATIWAQGGGQGDSRLGAKAGYVGNFFNVDVFQTTNVPANTRTDLVHDGAMFSKGEARALAHVSKRDSRTEFERDASARLSEMTVTARYADAELVDEYGEVLTSLRT